MKLIPLHEVKDIDLLRAGLTTVYLLQENGPISETSRWAVGCRAGFNHTMSDTKEDIEGELPYRFCTVCGYVEQASPLPRAMNLAIDKKRGLAL